MKHSVEIRAADSADANTLSELAFRSKAYWGYSDEFMEACRQELMVSEAKLADSRYVHFVGVLNNGVVAYYALEMLSLNHVDLHALFVEPEYIGQGVGGRLMQHAIEYSKKQGAKKMLIQSDPQAADFYRAAGAVQVAERESGSVAGRFLPEFELSLIDADSV